MLQLQSLAVEVGERVDSGDELAVVQALNGVTFAALLFLGVGTTKDDQFILLAKLPNGEMVEYDVERPEGLPPPSAGLFGAMGYDMIRLVERLPDVNPDPLDLPDGVMTRPSIVPEIPM